jgi:hypothetical protein
MSGADEGWFLEALRVQRELRGNKHICIVFNIRLSSKQSLIAEIH